MGNVTGIDHLTAVPTWPQEIIVPKFDLQSDGKVPEPVCRKVDAWLRRAMKSTPRAVLTLSYPTDKEITMQNHYKQRRMKLR